MGRIEGAVVSVTDLNLLPILAEEGKVGFVAEEDDLFIRAIPNEDGDSMRRMARDKVHRALDGVEVTAAIGSDYDARWCWALEEPTWFGMSRRGQW